MYSELNEEILDDIIGQTIELDCEPGSLRPGDLIDQVIKDTELSQRDPVSKSFGNWTWDYNDIDKSI